MEHRRSKKLWIIIAAAILLVTTVALLLVLKPWDKNDQQQQRQNQQEQQQVIDFEQHRISEVTDYTGQGLLLSCDEELLTTDEAIQAELMLEIPGALELSQVTVYGSGEEVLVSFAPQSGQSKFSVTIPSGVDAYGVWAQMGNYESNTVIFQRNWELTDALEEELSGVMNDAQALYEQYAAESMTLEQAKEVAQKICAALSEHPSVKRCWIENALTVYYVTDGGLVAGCDVNYTIDSPDQRLAGSGDVAPQNVQEQFHFDFSYKDVCLDPDVMLLLPLFEYSDRDGKSHLKSCEKLATFMGGAVTAYTEKQDATWPLITLLSDQVVEFGTVVWVTHGGSLSRGDGTKFVTEAFSHHREYSDMINQAKNVSDTFGIAFTAAEYEKGKDEKTYFGADVVFVLDFWTGDYQINITSNALMRCWDDLRFSNTVFYFGSCNSFEDAKFNRFLMERGAACVLGYEGAAYIPAEKATFDALVKEMMDDASATQTDAHTVTVGDAQEKSYNCIKKLLHSMGASIGSIIRSIETTVEVSLYGNIGYSYKGAGILAGSVIDEEGNFLSNATVTAYRYWNGELRQQGQVQSGADGKFEMQQMPWGIYILQAVHDEQEMFTQVTLGHANPSRMDISFIIHGEQFVTSENFALSDGFIVPVQRKTQVPEGYTGVYSYEDLAVIQASNAEKKGLSGNLTEINSVTEGKYILMNNITCPDDYETALVFAGILDGNGYTISNVNKPLFYYLVHAQIRNLGVELAVTTCEFDLAGHAYSEFGGIAVKSYIRNGSGNKLDNCFATGYINVPDNGEMVGGLLADSDSVQVKNCYNAANITVSGANFGSTFVGGIIGYGEVEENCFNSGNITVTDVGGCGVGGITGGASGGMRYCYNTGNITVCAVKEGAGLVGGLVGDSGGYNNDTMGMLYCYNTGDVSVSTDYPPESMEFFESQEENIDDIFSSPFIAGGIAGGRRRIHAEYCWNSGNICGKNAAGGIAGAGLVSVRNCYNIGMVSAEDYAGGLVGKIIGDQEKITTCYSCGPVSDAKFMGALVGDARNSERLFKDCYYMDSLSAVIAGGSKPGATELKNGAKLQDFKGFSFDFVWLFHKRPVLCNMKNP